MKELSTSETLSNPLSSFRAKVGWPLLASALFQTAALFYIGQIEHRPQTFYILLVGLCISLILIYWAWYRPVYYTMLSLRRTLQLIDLVYQGEEVDFRLTKQISKEFEVIQKHILDSAYSFRVAREIILGIGEGNFEKTTLEQDLLENEESSQNHDLIQSLVQVRNQLHSSNIEDQQRSWIAEGMARFADILRSNDDDLKTLCDRVIRGLVRYLEAHHGGIFVLHEEDQDSKALDLVSTFGYNQENFEANAKIKLGNFAENLVGQTYLEKETIHIKSIPNGFIQISSGLGSSKCQSILLVPLRLNERIEGVIELASLHTITPTQVELVERLAENITSAILSLKVSDHTRQLLRESQELTYKLQSQEEELRQNYDALQDAQESVEHQNKLIEAQKEKIEKALSDQTEKNEMLEAQEEEMKQQMEILVATQQQMMETQAELDGQLNAINRSSIGKVEYSLDGKVIKANGSFCKMLGFSPEEVQEKEHLDFAETRLSDSEAHKHFWEALVEGDSKSGEYKLMDKKGEAFWVNAVYSPVFNKQGEPNKIVQLAFNITDSKKLLEETRHQAEVLQAKESELRKNMRELQNAQDELNRKSKMIIELKEEDAKRARLKAKEIESKNQLITSSIKYAKNIQQAILPSTERIRRFVSDLFVIYKPKDIVSGDFYWFVQDQGKSFIAVVDCTGHGVPGAFMSIIGNTLLNEIVSVQKIHEPHRILELLHEGVRTRLKQEKSSNKDGMDLIICRLTPQKAKTVEICFAGAKRPLWYYDGGALQELNGDRKNIGGWQKEENRTFNQKLIRLKQDDKLYLFTDGIVDNPNSKRKKYGTGRLKEFIEETLTLDMSIVKNKLEQEIDQHQEDAEQRDDITFIGITL